MFYDLVNFFLSLILEDKPTMGKCEFRIINCCKIVYLLKFWKEFFFWLLTLMSRLNHFIMM